MPQLKAAIEELQGKGYPIPDYPDDPAVRDLQETPDDVKVVVINELLVRGNLPAATREVQQRLLTSN